MGPSIRCRVTGCDLDECGICRRCGDASKAAHQWKEADREKPCYERKLCERCGEEKSQPDHDWQTGTSAVTGEIEMKCSRCGLLI